MARFWLLTLSVSLLLAAGAARAQARAEPPPADEKSGVPAGAPGTPAKSPAEQPGGDPFSRLKVVLPKDKLPPLGSVRVRDSREAQDRSRKGTITVSVGSSPKGASVYYGGKLLGTTPLALAAHRGSTPWDVVIRRGGYMTLHTRLMRKVSRGYFFKLTPAKLR